MTETKILYAAMPKAFSAIEGASKNKANPQFKGTKYADLLSVVSAIKPALIANELWFAQINHEQSGSICIETVLFHSSGDQLSFGKLFVPASKNDAQGYGSALTYARRYSLLTAFGACPDDDDGNAAVQAKPKQDRDNIQNAGVITDDQRIELVGMFEALNVNIQVFLEFAGIKNLSMLAADRFNDAQAKIIEMSKDKQNG